MAKILVLAAAVALSLAGAAHAADAGGAVSSPPNTTQLPPTFFGPFHTNMPIAFGPGPADSGLSGAGGSGAGTGAGAPGMAGTPWAFSRGGGVGRSTSQTQTPVPQPVTTAQPGTTAPRGGPSVLFGRFGR